MLDLLVSGVKPTSIPHIGNYIGALKQWQGLQHSYRCFFFIADLHAITIDQHPQELRDWILETAAVYLAIGLDPARATIFVQSDVAEHSELAWILGTQTKLGELERMTQFKDKATKEHAERLGLGLFAYPTLMTADILLYDATVVPVGEDQVQHLELARTIAQRFNHKFGPTFTEPKAFVQQQGARIMSLQHPEKKMSKSDGQGLGTIFLTDDSDTIRRKIMKAVTDTGGGVSYDLDTKPAVANLLDIYHHMTGENVQALEDKFAGQGYGDFKKSLAEAVMTHLVPIGKRIREYLADRGELQRVLNTGRDAAQMIASEKMKLVHDRVGLGR